MKAVFGKKLGMTQVFDKEGSVIGVTVVQTGPCVVLQRKTKAKDGYSAIQLGFQDKKESRSNKCEKGHVKKSGLKTGQRYISEVRIPEELNVEPGNIINSNVFTVGEKIHVIGISMGRGFAGAIKRHGFKISPRSHGAKMGRHPGTLGRGTGKSNVEKGQKEPGHMGDVRVTVRNLKVIDILDEGKVMLIKGAVPGPRNSIIEIITKDSEYDLTKIIKSAAVSVEQPAEVK